MFAVRIPNGNDSMHVIKMPLVSRLERKELLIGLCSSEKELKVQLPCTLILLNIL